MSTITKLALILGLGMVRLAPGQITLILGTPNRMSLAEYSASTADVGADGSVVLGQTLIDADTHKAFEWIDIDYDRRQAYLSAGRSTGIVLDLNSSKVVKRCEIPGTPGKRLIYQWLIDDPQHGPIFTFVRGNSEVGEESLFGFIANPSITCEESLRPLRNDQIASFVSSGQAGVGGEAIQFTFRANVVDGRIRALVGRDPVWFPISFDPKLISEFDLNTVNVVGILARNQSVEVISISRATPDTVSYWARERSDGKWTRLPIPKGHSPNLRSFGTLLAWPESIYEEFQEAQVKADPRLAATRAVSGGPKEWRKTETRWGKNTEFVLTHSSTIHPGILHVFDVKTNTHFQVRTSQSDSEVLLIDKNQVYYRSSDTLYTAIISGDHLTVPKKIAQSELIRDAHWAYIPQEYSNPRKSR